MTFEHKASAPREARRAVRRLIPADDDPIAEAVEVVTSELVSNVVQHTDDGGTVRAWDPKPDVPVRVEVTDRDGSVPEPASEASETGGRGLRIVDELTDGWGVERDVRGKTVWAEFNRDAH